MIKRLKLSKNNEKKNVKNDKFSLVFLNIEKLISGARLLVTLGGKKCLVSVVSNIFVIKSTLSSAQMPFIALGTSEEVCAIKRISTSIVF